MELCPPLLQINSLDPPLSDQGMNLWQRASGALKDRTALMSATLSRRRSHRNPDLEAAIIKATNHNECSVDYRNAQRVFGWIRTSPVSLKPLIWALTSRVEKTKSWVVALKSLMLMHGVFCLKTPAVLRIGKLPFDLSNFSDGHHKSRDAMWGFNAFIRSYYTYLDRRCSLLYSQPPHTEDKLASDILKLENLQSLLDILLQIRPIGKNMKVDLILEAMDCVVIEIFDVCNRICNLNDNVLMGVYSVGKVEAAMALKVLQKAIAQGDDLTRYFEFCQEFGVFNAMEIPKTAKIPEQEIIYIQGLINGRKNDIEIVNTSQSTNINRVCERKNSLEVVVTPQLKNVDGDNEKNLATEEKGSKISRLKTIITDKWELFDEDNNNNENHSLLKVDEANEIYHFRKSSNPFDLPSNCLPLVPVYKHDQIPDFISFQ